MKGVLNDNQVDYVLFHLWHHVIISEENRRSFKIVRGLEETGALRNQVIFLLSEKDVDNGYDVDGISVLFPVMTERKIPFLWDDRGNLIFCHDFLKSIFYLLSGYQEYANTNSKDNLRRFSFDDSIQKQLGFIHKPVVNYYFEFLVRGLEEFGLRKGVDVKRRRLFTNFGFLLTHDIDKIDLFDVYYLGYKLKELIGLRKSRLGIGENLGVLFKGVLQWLHLTRGNNPYWNFDFLRRVERERNFRSVFFFLDQGMKHSDAYYSFHEERVKSLFHFLREEGCEIGLHGTVLSIDNPGIMASSLKKLAAVAGVPITGMRQHRLLWKHPLTASIQKSVGLDYDCTLGFAAHEGFRNSYCWPFKLFDFETNRMIDNWEFPLNVMDGTLFAYREYTPSDAMGKCMELIAEIAKFGGVFDLLWHNSFFDDQTYPGVTQFYLELLDIIRRMQPENVVGSELLSLMNDHVATKP